MDNIAKSEIAGAVIAAKALLRELGFAGMIGVFARVGAAQAAGEPWKKLGAPADKQEALSRRQLGSAVLLDRALRKNAGRERARKIVAGIVLEASVDFLGRNVPVLNRASILSMSEAERKRFLSGINAKFFNADAGMEMRGEECLLWTISRCRFVELLDAIGERDMAPVFCEGDRVFFDEHQPDVRLERPCTLASGGSCCDFRFFFKD